MRAGSKYRAQKVKNPQGLMAVGAGLGESVKRQVNCRLTDRLRRVATYRRVGTSTAAQGPVKAAGSTATLAADKSKDDI